MADSRQPWLRASPLSVHSLGIPGGRERYAIRKGIIAKKLNTTLLPAMRRHGIDMWLILSRECHPDPLLPDLGGGGREGVRHAYIFFDNGGEVPEKIFICSHGQREDLYDEVYDQVLLYGYSQEGLTPHLREAVHQRDPKRIGINMSPTLPMADGLSVTLKHYLEEAIGPQYAGRLVSAELVARDFRALRLPEEFGIYGRLCEWTQAWVAEALSQRVVWPTVTTCGDICSWMCDKATELGLGLADVGGMIPHARIDRQGQRIFAKPQEEPILPGDIITVDYGLAFDLYRTDYQRTAYVLRAGETEPPESLQRAFREALRVRDQLTANMQPGEIGHQVWEKTMTWAQSEGYEDVHPTPAGRRPPVTTRQVGIYCHSVGNSVHDMGARINVDWPVTYGDRARYPLELNQWYAIEMCVFVPIPEWDGRAVFIGIEEDVALTERGVEYFAQPQTELIVIPT